MKIRVNDYNFKPGFFDNVWPLKDIILIVWLTWDHHQKLMWCRFGSRPRRAFLTSS
jgi:hypothetical protein